MSGSREDSALNGGQVRLPGGGVLSGRPATAPAPPADLVIALVAGRQPTAGEVRRIVWPDFWIPRDTEQALSTLEYARTSIYRGRRVEVVCRGGIGRTGTAIAAIAVLDGVPPDQALGWVRENYHRRAVETPWQRWWLSRVRPFTDADPQQRPR